MVVLPPSVSSVRVAPAPVLGGVSTKVAVYLNAVAPSGGFPVTVSSNSAAASLAGTITVPAGATAANETVTTTPVASSTTVTITAKTGTTSVQTTFSVVPPSVDLVKVAPAPVLGGVSTKVAVYLSGAAPTGGFPVTVSSNNAAAALAGTITVPAGATAANETVTTTPVASSTTVTITAKTSATSVTTTFSVVPPSVSVVRVAPSPVVGGNGTKVAVYLTGAAPTGGYVVTLKSSNPAVVVPGTIPVPAGATAANGPVTTSKVTSSTTVTITATTGSTSVTTTMVVNPEGVLSPEP
jgi:hypothetical protein